MMAAQIPDGVRFVDIALEAGLKDIFYCEGERTKNYIIETIETGTALLDYDNDRDLDIFIVNASKLEGFPAGEEPTNHLYRNDGAGKLKDVTREAGLGAMGDGARSVRRRHRQRWTHRFVRHVLGPRCSVQKHRQRYIPGCDYSRPA